MLAFLLLTLSSSVELLAQRYIEGPGIEYPIQEPLIFRARRGTATTDAVERWKQAHTEENIKRIAATGHRVLYTHFYKGFGFEAEKPEMDLTVRTAEWARKYGMVAGTYIQWGTMVLESMLQEEPRARDWVLRDRDGHPVKIAYGHYYWRYLPDVRNKEYREWFKEKVIRYCIENVKPKNIHFDNVAENPPVDWQPLHNPTWVEGFRNYLRDNYTSAQLTRMLGYPQVDFIEPPYWVWGSNVVVNDPLMQRWIDFRCKSVADAIEDVCAFIHELDPSIAVTVNIHGISRENRAINGIDPVAVCNGPGVSGWGGELWVQAELTPENVLISPIREYKVCRTIQTAFVSGGRTPLGKAVNRAFSYRLNIPGSGYLGGPDRFGYLAGPKPGDTWHQYADYYRETETVADVAVLRSYPSLAYNSYATLAGVIGFEQTLIQAKIPFDIIFEKNLADLSKYKVLVLANTECMSDGDIELIRDFVRGGGGVVATGSASLYDQWRRPRPNFGLADVLNLTGDEAQNTLGGYRISDAMSTWIGVEGVNTKMTEFGRGRAVYVPRVIPAFQGNAVKLNLPLNWPELVEAVKWAAGDDLSIEVNAPLTVVMNLYEKKKDDLLLLHLVNFKQDTIESIPIDLKIPLGKEVKSVTLISTDREGKTVVKFAQENGRLKFRVPLLEIYDLLIIQLG
ncbi:hypothetical protein ACFLT7_04490 [candidate division KSB1 bacterium]